MVSSMVDAPYGESRVRKTVQRSESQVGRGSRARIGNLPRALGSIGEAGFEALRVQGNCCFARDFPRKPPESMNEAQAQCRSTGRCPGFLRHLSGPVFDELASGGRESPGFRRFRDSQTGKLTHPARPLNGIGGPKHARRRMAAMADLRPESV